MLQAAQHPGSGCYQGQVFRRHVASSVYSSSVLYLGHNDRLGPTLMRMTRIGTYVPVERYA